MWGTISDGIGRKVKSKCRLCSCICYFSAPSGCVGSDVQVELQPVLLLGNISACLSVTALGLAPNYAAAVASRFIGVLFTSSSGV